MSGEPGLQPVRPGRLVAVAVVVAALAWVVLRAVERSGGAPLPLPWTAVAGMLAVTAAVLLSGRPVRRWTGGDRSHDLDPLRAARVLVLARACAYTGAALAGFYAAQALLVVPDLAVEARQHRFWTALAATGAALVMVAAGLLVERWCKVPPDDDEAPPSGTSTA